MQRTRAGLFHSGLARRVSRRLRNCVLAAALLLATPIQTAAAGIFDVHVHLWNGEESLRTYEEQLKRDNLEASGIGVMWFGGPNQALTGDPDRIKAGNDGIIALASTNRKLLPIATVHPYDGPAAVAELERVAAKGVKVLKLHPHTQNSVLQTRARSRSFGRGSLALSSCSTMPASFPATARSCSTLP